MNIRSSRDFGIGAGIASISTGEQNVALSFFLELVNMFTPSSMLVCGRISLVSKFPLVTSPQTWVRTDCAHEVHTYE